MADTWDHVHSSPQEMRLPQLVLPLEANHGTTQVTLNLYPKSHVWPFCFPNVDTAGNFLDPHSLILRGINPSKNGYVKEKNAANEDC